MTGKLHWAHKLGDQTSPGPGSYNIPSCFGNSSPRFSIRRRFPDKKTESCPEFLDIRPRNNSPKYSIRPKINTPDTSCTPGPSYVPKPMGSHLYKTNHPKRGKKITSPRQRKYEIYDKSIQGPAEYDISKANYQRSQYTYIGKKEKSAWLESSQNPAPDAYRPDFAKTKPRSPRYSIRQNHKAKDETIGPGPGGINIPSDFGKGNATIHIRHKEFEPFETPGPGQYEVANQIGKDARASTIGPRLDKKPSLDTIEELVMLPSIFGTSRGISIGSKRDNKIPKTPGPGDYDISQNNYKNGIRLTPKETEEDIRKREEFKKKLPYVGEDPGPGTYSPMFDPVYPHSPRFSFGEKTEYQTAVSTKDNGVPSPDMYKTTDDEIMVNSPKFTIKGRNFVPDPKSSTLEVDYAILRPDRGLSFTIGLRDEIELIPK